MAKSDQYLLTTFDNYDSPWTDYEKWDAFDQAAGYNTAALIARVANYEPDDSEELQEQKFTNAMQTILENDFLGVYKKIYENQEVDPELCELYNKWLKEEKNKKEKVNEN